MVNIIVVLLIVGALLYVLPMVPIDATVKRIIQVIVIVAAVIWLLRTYATGVI